MRKCENVSPWVSGTIARTKRVLKLERKILVGPKRDMRGSVSWMEGSVEKLFGLEMLNHLDCNEDKCKLGGDQGARDQGGEVGWKPFTLWEKVEMV